MSAIYDEPSLKEREEAPEEAQPSTGANQELQQLNSFSPTADTSSFASGPLKSSSNKLPDTEPKATEKPSGNVDTGLYSGGYVKRKTKGWINKRKAAAISGVLAATLGLSAAVVSPFTSGLPFLDFGNLLGVHADAMSDATDVRMNALYRYAKTGNAGETRIGYLESKHINRMQSDMEKVGIKPVFDGQTGQYKGVRIDTKADDSPYKGMSDEEVKQHVEAKFGADAIAERDGQLFLNLENKSAFKQYRTLKTISTEMGNNGILAALKARPMAKKANISLHPMAKIENKVQNLTFNKINALREKRKATISGTEEGSASRVDTRGATQQSEDGKTSTPVDGSEQTLDSKNTKSVFKQLGSGKGLAVTGGIGAVVGISCLSRELATKIGEYSYDKTAIESMRLGMYYTSVKSQIESGADFGNDNLDLEYEYLGSTDENGNVSDYSQSAALRANNGGSGGVPTDPALLQSLQAAVPSWLQWALSSPVEAACSGIGSIIIGGASLITTIASGGTIGFLASFLAQPITGMIREKALDTLTVYISGEGMNLANAVGVNLANIADLGNFLFFNGVAINGGATALSTAQTAQLSEYNKAYEDFAFERKPLKEKVFDVKDKRSLTGKIARAYPTSVSDASSDIASLFTGSFGSLVTRISSLNPKARAATAAYDYGIPKFGYSISELTDKRFQNPYENAKLAAALFDTSAGGDYIAKAQKCFGASISKTPQGWSSVVTEDAYRRYFTEDKNVECGQNKDENWSRTRLFIFDTSTMDAYACLQGEASSCDNSGFGSENTEASSTGSVGTIPTGAAQDLAQQILDSPNISFQADRESLFKSVAATGGQQACGKFVPISPKLLGVILALSEKYKIVLGVFAADHGCGSDHEKGLAVDINGVNPLSGSGGTGNFLSNKQSPKSYSLPIVSSFYVDIAKTLSANGGGKINQYWCFGDAGVEPPNVSSISGVYTGWPDSCTHLHMAVKE